MDMKTMQFKSSQAQAMQGTQYFEKHRIAIIVHGCFAIYFTYWLCQKMTSGAADTDWVRVMIVGVMAVCSFISWVGLLRTPKTWLFTLTEMGLAYHFSAIFREYDGDNSLPYLGFIAWRDLATCEVEKSLFLKTPFLVCKLRSDETQILKIRLRPFSQQERENIVQSIQKHIQAA